MQKILNASDIQRQGVKDFTAVVLKRRGLARLTPVVASTITVRAEVNHGRWIVRCPFCSGAELADTDDHRFFCLSCYNESASGAWLVVEWPRERVAIESVLEERRDVATLNWLPGETAADLVAEMEAHSNLDSRLTRIDGNV